MSRTANLKKLIADNPKVNEKELNDGLRAVRKIRKLGIRGSSYNIDPPFRRRPSGESPNESERSIRTRR